MQHILSTGALTVTRRTSSTRGGPFGRLRGARNAVNEVGLHLLSGFVFDRHMLELVNLVVGPRNGCALLSLLLERAFAVRRQDKCGAVIVASNGARVPGLITQTYGPESENILTFTNQQLRKTIQGDYVAANCATSQVASQTTCCSVWPLVSVKWEQLFTLSVVTGVIVHDSPPKIMLKWKILNNSKSV